MLAVRGQRDRAHVNAAAPRSRNDEIRMTKAELMTKPERVTNERFSFAIPSSHSPVMLSEAKHLRLFSFGTRRNEKDQRLKAWPRGLRPLRCSFASLRMTVSELFHSFDHSSFVLRHSLRSRDRHRASRKAPHHRKRSLGFCVDR